MLLEFAKARQYTSPGYLDARVALHRRFTPPGHDVSDFLWARYSFARQAHVLEVGCGTGEFWLCPTARLPEGLRVTLTDRSAGMVTRTRLSVHALPVEHYFAAADITALPFDSATFDATLAHYMLYHTPDKVRALAELKRVVKPRGWLGIALTAPANMSRIVDMLVQTVPELAVPPRDSSAFNVSVAEPLIRSVFRSVRRHDYEYTMNVTEPEYVVNYAQSLSTLQAANLTTDQWQRYADAVAEDIRTTGSFRVVKSASLFVCRP
jgi:ubiquinone/menaquinone biosynthesis C-methylase UbiE